MKTLSDYMAMSYRMEIVEDKDEGGFVVSYPDLPGCITCGETVESAVVIGPCVTNTFLFVLSTFQEEADSHRNNWPYTRCEQG